MLPSNSELSAVTPGWTRGRRSLVSALSAACLIWAVLALGGSGAALGAGVQERVSTLVLGTFSFEHQPAREALVLIEPLLSAQGTVSIDRQQNTVVVRDHQNVVETLRPLLIEFDHPPRWLRLEVHVLQAERVRAIEDGSQQEPGPRPQPGLGAPNQRIPVVRVGSRGVGVGGPEPQDVAPIPKELRQSLGGLLAFSRYQLLGRTMIVAREGQSVERSLGGYQVSFDVGTVLLNRRLRLRSLELAEIDGDSDGRPLFHSDINLHSTKPLLVTVSADAESSKGLVLAVRWLDTPRVSPPVQAR